MAVGHTLHSIWSNKFTLLLSVRHLFQFLHVSVDNTVTFFEFWSNLKYSLNISSRN